MKIKSKIETMKCGRGHYFIVVLEAGEEIKKELRVHYHPQYDNGVVGNVGVPGDTLGWYRMKGGKEMRKIICPRCCEAIDLTIAGSVNGKPTGFDPVNIGSNPIPAGLN